ncbi:c-type cytochrome biogenesis protein CcmI [Pacificibacter marinus]|uniref:c-type cytochrome biogenesis protein CcmI n=1 Tax=Pacificibacter marinus TaxID=658057 RepID=UPI001C06F817|nr:c-type cytochrome biogenesis protein CcmI [Pacificibacter marinus]MBU2866358.1 c-type cytochrome biogenesis protein CcmI [Pacificibacter marinus]
MTFWIIATIIALLASAPLVLVLLRKRGSIADDIGNTAIELRVYKDQLNEVDRDLTRGMLTEEAAKRARLEISRRMLEADSKKDRHSTKDAALPLWAALLIGAMVFGGGVWLYTVEGAPTYQDLPLKTRLALAQEIRETRPTQADAEDSAPASPPLETPNPQHLELLDQLRAALETRPDDLQGHMLLARNASVVGEYREAYAAQTRVIAIKGDAATAEDYATLADLMILAVGGYVSPEAETAITKSLARDAGNGTANYYAGLMFAQTGRPDMTFRLWSRLLSNSAPDDLWVAPIRDQIESVAFAAGERYTLPPLAASESPLKGPTADDVEAAADMDAGDRMAFIQSMVDQLSARLANDGGTPDEWAQLISALGVLGDTSRARAIWGEAQVIFGPDATALATVRKAAQSAGIVQ